MISYLLSNGLALAAALLAVAGPLPQTATAPAQVTAPATATAAAPQSATASSIDGGTPSYVKPETAEERAKRVGPVDPGLNPDESTLFYRYGRAFNIVKYEKKWATFDQPTGYVRPVANTPFVFEVYQVNDKYVWVWMEQPGQNQPTEPETPNGAEAKDKSTYTPPQLKYLTEIKPEFTALDVPSANVTINFAESSDGLPMEGSWRNNWIVADMNGDGFPDIVAPPQRGGDGIPSVYLGDGKGHWRPWNEAVWPYAIDYGAVAAADFNKDGHMDLAFAVHLHGVVVFLGDGKGKFVESSDGLPTSGWGSRAIVAADFDGDGVPDLAAATEGPSPNTSGEASGKIRVFLNREHAKHWKNVDVAGPSEPVGGDYLVAGNFNGDRIPDLASANIYFGAGESIFLSNKKKTWDVLGGDGRIVPYLSYYFAVAAGHVTSKKTDDAVLSFVRHWPDDASKLVGGAPPVNPVAGIDRISFAGGVPRRSSVVRFSSNRPISGLAVADFDGDGNMDIVFTRFDPRRECVILLGDGKGHFKQATVAGLPLENLANYNLAVADVNGDHRPDVIIGYEAGDATKAGVQKGSLHVFLNKGATRVGTDSRKKPAK